MARKVQVHLLDDIDGSQADETLRFGLDGTSYEIDLSARHAEKLRAALAKFVLSSRRVGRSRVAAAPPRRAGTPARVDRAQNQAIREWAKSRGIEISGRGRIPAHIVEQYHAGAGR